MILFYENGVARELPVLEKPMTVEQLLANSRNGVVEAIVLCDLNDIVEGDLESFLDDLSEKVTGHVCGLENISYQPVGVVSGQLAVLVAGHVGDYLAEEDE